MAQGIGPVEAVGGESSPSVTPSQLVQAHQEALAAVAKRLGLSTSDLRGQLQEGQGLPEIAASKGVSSQEVTKTVEAAVQEFHPGASDRTMAALVERMISELQRRAATVQSATSAAVAGKPAGAGARFNIVA